MLDAVGYHLTPVLPTPPPMSVIEGVAVSPPASVPPHREVHSELVGDVGR